MERNSKTTRKFPKKFLEKAESEIKNSGDEWYALARRRIKLQEKETDILCQEIDWETDTNWEKHKRQHRALESIEKAIHILEARQDKLLNRELMVYKLIN